MLNSLTQIIWCRSSFRHLLFDSSSLLVTRPRAQRALLKALKYAGQTEVKFWCQLHKDTVFTRVQVTPKYKTHLKFCFDFLVLGHIKIVQ